MDTELSTLQKIRQMFTFCKDQSSVSNLLNFYNNLELEMINNDNLIWVLLILFIYCLLGIILLSLIVCVCLSSTESQSNDQVDLEKRGNTF